jgi:uncharacterized protein
MIHQFSLFGTNIAMDINSGAIHILDDVSHDVLGFYDKNDSSKLEYKLLDKEEIINKLLPRYKKEEILEAFDEIETLEKNGLLFSEDTYAEYMPAWEKGTVVKALCLHISHDCNLRCKYCFAKEGSFGGERINMSLEVGEKAIDFLINESVGRKNLEIDFFGGEPLLNFEVVKGIVAYAKSKEKEFDKNFRFTITTNALLLNEETNKFINENMYNLVLSIDGRAETNDNMRIRVDGRGTYKDILAKIKEVVDLRNGENYYVRGTFTRENIEFSKDVLHLADQGFKQISVEPVVAAKESGFDLREEDLPVLLNEYEKLAFEYVEREKREDGFNFFHFMIDLEQGPCIAKRVRGCGSGHEYLSITPEGDVYPCHQFVGMKDFKMGNLIKSDIKRDLQTAFKKSNVYTKKDCTECFAKFYCSGGCAANAYQFNNDINSTYKIGCELEKKRIECALWIKSQLA